MIIIWDFDGVIVDSDNIRTRGFEYAVEPFDDREKAKTKALIEFHKANGGLSRYVKFEYFLNGIIPQRNHAKTMTILLERYSWFMSEHLFDERILKPDAIALLNFLSGRFPMFIASGSNNQEINALCQHLDIAHFFKGIYGSPISKNYLVHSILKSEDILTAYLIGDSFNDLEAARENHIQFIGTANSNLDSESDIYVESLEELISKPPWH